jgi:hypothetical protein
MRLEALLRVEAFQTFEPFQATITEVNLTSFCILLQIEKHLLRFLFSQEV